MPPSSQAHRNEHQAGHTLGPHVVGQRVVVRRVVPGETGPSGGPAMTDVLGTCLRWSDDECVVQPETGEPVTIPLALVVSGKPVPPRPSVRHRVDAREAEGHALAMWPHVETEALGDWVMRTDPAPVGRLLKRANSCLAIGDPGVSLDDAAARVRAFYADRDRDALAQVEAGSEVDTHLDVAGWTEVEGGASYFQVASLARALRACGGREPAEAAELVELEDGPRVELRLVRSGEVVAGGRAALDGDWLGVHALGMEPRLRRRGLATAMMARLLDWGGAQGATTTWLHVEVDNEPALALYAGMGFRTHHRLRYLRAAGR
ncbi:GNAT family N-acetyltransferase [Nocardioides aestuarii]|uniref:GNAT family N-acetyltransferase n=1 Tax=Nocardioides aestuarii TaxID=252231 RepID=A0ABW4TKA3_9ACTN